MHSHGPSATDPVNHSVFDLRDPRKADSGLIGDDLIHFTAITRHVSALLDDLTTRLAGLRRNEGGGGRRALDRDLEIHRTQARVSALRRQRNDLCLGRLSMLDGRRIYIGRVGLTTADGTTLLIDWRVPAAAAFFAATTAAPHGVGSRRRYRWAHGRVIDYWDEALGSHSSVGLSLDGDSALLHSLQEARAPQMRDVLSTIAADQDAAIRASSSGVRIVDGGPGTGKTVVALHRAAYLLHSDRRLRGNRGELLVVGPHQPYLAYVSDVLPGLGEEGVAACTLADMVPEGEIASAETDSDESRVKSAIDPIPVIDRAVGFYETPPDHDIEVATPWDDVVLTASDWAAAYAAVEPGTPHNEARDTIWTELVELVAARHDRRPPTDQLRKSLADNSTLVREFSRGWPVLDAPTVVADLWSVPAYLRLCAPTLSADDVRAVHRPHPAPWTVDDLPLLDAARRRLGDPQFSRRERERESRLAADAEEMDRVVDQLVDAHGFDDGEGLSQMLTGDDLRNALIDESGRGSSIARDRYAGPFAHIVVDEAQELTDAQWSMLLARCPTQSFTVVGDRAQSRRGFTESWEQRLRRVGFTRIARSELTVNYRTPSEIMAAASPVIQAALPQVSVPSSIRSSGRPVRHAARTEIGSLVAQWLVDNDDGTVCIVGDLGTVGDLDAILDGSPHGRHRVRRFAPAATKGLEFDLVVLVDPDGFGRGVTGAVDRYVAMTRATQELIIAT